VRNRIHAYYLCRLWRQPSRDRMFLLLCLRGVECVQDGPHMPCMLLYLSDVPLVTFVSNIIRTNWHQHSVPRPITSLLGLFPLRVVCVQSKRVGMFSWHSAPCQTHRLLVIYERLVPRFPPEAISLHWNSAFLHPSIFFPTTDVPGALEIRMLSRNTTRHQSVQDARITMSLVVWL
jgi:hypothetical protein